MFAKHTNTAAVGNLSVKEGRYHRVAAGFKIAAFGRLNEHNLFVLGLSAVLSAAAALWVMVPMVNASSVLRSRNGEDVMCIMSP